MKRLLALVLCLGLANTASAQIFDEDFDSGAWPPAGWTIVNNGTAVTAAWDINSNTGAFNYAGAGFCATADSDYYAMNAHMLTELWTSPFDLPAAPKVVQFGLDFWTVLAGETGAFDISTDGGLTWTNLKLYTTDAWGTTAQVDLTAYAGQTGLIFRWDYDDNNSWSWHWQVDDVHVLDAPGSICFQWIEDFDSGTWPPAGWAVVDNTTNNMPWHLSTAFPMGNTVFGGSGDCALLDSDFYGSAGTQDSELWTVPFDVPAVGDFKLLWLEDYYPLADISTVDISLDGGTTWTTLLTQSTLINNNGPQSVSLVPYAGQIGVIVRYRYIGAWDWWWGVDNVMLVNEASATFRNGGNNPPVFTVTGPPIMDASFDASIDAGAVGHGYAQLFGYDGPLSITIGFQKTILVDISGAELLALPALPGSVVTYTIGVPSDCLFAGYSLSTQAAVFTVSAPPIQWALTNAQDLVVGY